MSERGYKWAYRAGNKHHFAAVQPCTIIHYRLNIERVKKHLPILNSMPILLHTEQIVQLQILLAVYCM